MRAERRTIIIINAGRVRKKMVAFAKSTIETDRHTAESIGIKGSIVDDGKRSMMTNGMFRGWIAVACVIVLNTQTHNI